MKQQSKAHKVAPMPNPDTEQPSRPVVLTLATSSPPHGEDTFQDRKDFSKAFADIVKGITDTRVWWHMAAVDIKRRYRRTVIGPFWASLSLAIFVASMGFLFSKLWKTDIATFLPFFCSGFICWVFVSAIITESSVVFTSAEGLLKQVPLPYTLFSCTVVARNALVLAHHMVVYIIVALIFSVKVNVNTLLFIPGILLLCITGLWVSMLVGLACARYRDLQQLINNLLQIVMFVTPIFWPPEQLGSRKAVFVDANIFYHYVDIVRAPLMGKTPALLSWGVSLGFTLFGALFTFFIFAKLRRKLIFWL